MSVYWHQDYRPRKPRNDVAGMKDYARPDIEVRRCELEQSDEGDEIRKRIPKICRRSYHLSRSPDSHSDKVKPVIVRSNSIQDSLDEQIKTSENILKLQDTLGVEIVQKNGQRKLGGPPPGWVGPPPGHGCEIFVGKIPRNIYEDKIYPIFRQIGEIYEMRLMMNFSGTNRGFCFIMYKTPELAQKAIKTLNNYEILPGWRIGVIESVNNCRLHVTDLSPRLDVKTLTKRIWMDCEDIDKILFYTFLNHPSKKEALICFSTHRGAAMARRRLLPERSVFFDKPDVRIDWAHPKLTITNAIEECGIYHSDENITVTKRVIKGAKKNFPEDEDKFDGKYAIRKQKPFPTGSYQKIDSSTPKTTYANNNYIGNRIPRNRFNVGHPKPAFLGTNPNSYEQESNHSNGSFNNDYKFKLYNDSAKYSVRSDESLSDFSKTSDSDDYKMAAHMSPPNTVPAFLHPGNCSVVRFPWGLMQDSYNYSNVQRNNLYHVQYPWNQTSSFNNANNNLSVQTPTQNHGHIPVFNPIYFNNLQGTG